MRTTRRGAATFMIVAVAVVLGSSRAYPHTTLFAPNGGERLNSGDSFSILWEVTISHDLENWDLWYSVVSDGGPWIDIAMDLPGGDPSEGSLHSYDWLVPNVDAPNAWVRVRMDNGLDSDYYDVSNDSFSISVPNTLTCDFTADGMCEITDLNAMLLLGPVAPGIAVTSGVNDHFDLNNDQVIDNADVDEWLLLAAMENGFSGPYLRGDADLNGVVDFLDFNVWASHRFQGDLQWNHGDFNGNGIVDFLDFNIWATNRFQSTPMLAPEPSAWVLWCFGLVWCARRRTA